MKKYISIVVIVALFVSFFPIQVLFTSNMAHGGGMNLEGSGTAEDPYLVYTAEDINLVRKDLESHYEQRGNIDLTTYLSRGGDGYAKWQDDGWLPIGDSNVSFTGTYDGNGFTISNLMIERPNTNDTGLFGRIGTGGQILNISLENVEIQGLQYIGGLVGYLDGSIVNGSVQGNVIGHEDVGGLVGYVASQGSINQSFAAGKVLGTGNKIGGLVGSNSAEIKESYATGEVDGDNHSVGSLVGMNNGTVSKSYYNEDINGQDDEGKGYGRSTEDMKDKSTFQEWDFTTVWFMDASVNDGYPFFRSHNANLIDLEIDGGLWTLVPSFTASVEEYDLTLGYEVEAITVTPTVAEENAIVEVNGVEVDSGEGAVSVGLHDGTNTITVKVIAHNGSTNTYTITIEREAPFTLKYTAADNGSIDGETSQTVSGGQDGTAVKAIPDEGYRFVEWSDGTRMNPRIDQDVRGNLHVTALFETWETTIFTLDDDEADIKTMILGNDRLRNSTNANIDNPDDFTLRPGDEGEAYEYKYFSQTFTPTISGTYHFGNSQANVDTAMIIYEGEFDKENPAANFIGFNDDYDAQNIVIPEGAMCGRYIIRCPGIEAELEAYVSYIIITTTYNPEHSSNIKFPLEFFISGPGIVEEGKIELLPIVYSTLISDGKRVKVPDRDVKVLDNEGILVIELSGHFDHILDAALTKEQIQVLKKRQATIRIVKDDIELNIPASIFDENEDLVIHMERLIKDPEVIVDSNLSSSSIYQLILLQGDKYLNVFDHEIQLIFSVEEDGDLSPEEMKLYYLNEGKWELIGGEYADGKITAWTNHFSVFGVFHPRAFENKTNEEESIEEGVRLPDTATQSYNLLMVGVVLLMIGGSLVLNRRRIQ
ncbi:cadherin-like beta sandwich domain-containing protein [Evansella tamaricis]|uniref:Cadherin-like beta sandwich domain-containing protein n=1 Tax=Evansella tamaricis TaxID=2069301 RepID=A0ABS6JMA8_9BACI|nr:cadherin-like beta sandwich domain-containing protein [Evansella tamaricis]MBU9713453.1 cadherin-like beta sandwich domain-containing protein [Evansella tamaricis]